MENISTKIDRKTKSLFTKIGTIAEEAGMAVYPVGGYVRDLLLKRSGKDIDFVVIGDALELAGLLHKKMKTSRPVIYPKFGTSKVSWQDYELEFVTARQEYYHPDSRNPKVQPGSLETDLSRRDFTINTLSMQINTEHFGEIFDPYNGLTDLQNKLIRTPLEPEQTFSDDPLRMMRAIRFAATLQFEIAPGIFDAIKTVKDRLQIISQERITDELNKIMLSKKPSVGLDLLEQTGLLEIFLPEFVAAKGVEQRRDHHHKDVFYHTLQVIDQISARTDKLELRLAALFHDIAKPRTKRFDEKTGWTFHGHEVVGMRMTGAILKRLKYSNEIIEYVKKLVRLHLRPMVLVSDEVTDSAIRRLLFLAGNEFDDLMTLCRADITSKNPQKVKKHLKNYETVIQKAIVLEEKDRLRNFKSPVDGNEIMRIFGLKEGPKIGIIKKFIEEAILDGKIHNEHADALEFLLTNKSRFE